MRIKTFLLVISVVYFSAITAIAQPRQNVKIDHVTVFLSGAELSSSSKVTLSAGENTILFTNIAGNVNQQSLNIGADNDVVIQSASFQNNFLVAETLSPKGKELKDSIETIEASRAGTTNMLTVTNEQIAILSQNKQVTGANTGLSVAELTKLLDLVKTRLAGLLSEKDKLTNTLKKTDERLALLRLQLDLEQKKDFQPGGQLLVKFYAPKATTAYVNLSYVVPNAGWTPTYDLRVENLKDPVKLFYKANVYQNSGVKWDDVKITLSTGNPNEGAQAPVLSPWYLSFLQPTYRTQGYLNTYNAAPAAVADLMNEDVKQKSLGSMNQHVTVDNSGINTSFDIDLPYTIPTDGQTHLIAIKNYELPATYRYYAVPKIDRDAFLQAQVTNWEDLNLMPATTNIFYEGSYVGQGYIDMRNIKDTMNISLGRDKKIIIRRERDKELRSVKTIGTNIKESFVYTVSLRNTRKEAVNITILEQLPISNDKDIVVEDADTDNGGYDETTGEVKWTLQLKPNDIQKKHVGFTVKYPKGKSINL